MSRRLLSRNRSDASLARHYGRRARGVSVLFGCEGETEIEYLRGYCKQLGIRGEFPKSTTGLDPARLVGRTMASYDEDYDLVACVFDQDDHATFDEARSEIKRLMTQKRRPVPIVEAISMVCFELWILLHLERTDRPFGSAAEIIDHIQRYHIGDYNKAKAVELLPRIGSARENARWLEERYEQNGATGSMTTMHLLIDRLETIAGK